MRRRSRGESEPPSSLPPSGIDEPHGKGGNTLHLKYRTPAGTVQMTLARAFMNHRTPVQANPQGQTLPELVPDHDEALQSIMADAEWAFEQVKDKPVWAATLSGGKDSAATVCLAIEWLKRNPEVRPKLLLLHADTLQEAEPMETFARHLLDVMKAECDRHGIDCEIRIVEPIVEDDMWTMLLGYGYPPFSNNFRPCTDRMKRKPQIAVMNMVAQDFTPEGGQLGDVVALILGVRMDESDARRERLSKVCNLTDGECGQLLDAPQDMPGVTTVAPIINARTCKVWDLDMFILPALGWPTERLAEIYGDDVVRFGCWLCPLVKRVKDVENLAQLPEHAWMTALIRFREDFLREADKPDNRLKESTERQLQRVRDEIAALESVTDRDEDQTKRLEHLRKREAWLTNNPFTKRGTTLAFRRRWLGRLLEVQADTDRPLIRPEVVAHIRQLWATEAATGKRGKSGRAKGKEMGA